MCLHAFIMSTNKHTLREKTKLHLKLISKTHISNVHLWRDSFTLDIHIWAQDLQKKKRKKDMRTLKNRTLNKNNQLKMKHGVDQCPSHV